MSDDLTIEKLKLVERMEKLDVSMEKINGTLRLLNQTIQGMNEMVQSHSREIWGNGTPGLKTNIDRLIQWKSVVNKGLWAIILSLIAIVSKLVYETLVKLSP